jgi:hypothetical protein
MTVIVKQYEYVLQHHNTQNQEQIFSARHLPQLIDSNINTLYQ